MLKFKKKIRRQKVKEGEWDGIDWIYLAQNMDTRRTLVDKVKDVLALKYLANFFTTLTSCFKWRQSMFHLG